MSKYNLIRNSAFTASGDHTFTWLDLDTLQDGVTSSGGVSISGVNDLVVDLSQRVKVDGIRLYTSDLTKSSSIYFWYKNEISDEYIQLSTSVGSYYYTTIPDPSAPRYIKVTVSGVAMGLYEFQVFNNDYIVAFGEDGQQYAEYMENTPVGFEGLPQSIAIFNNSDYNMAANAYTCIEPVGSGYDDYIKISSSENGTYYKVSDGAVIKNDLLSSYLRWSDGVFSNTMVYIDKVKVSSGESGTYKSPIFELDDKYNASYLFIKGDSDPTTGNISYNESVYNGTIKVRSSNIKPIPIFESYVISRSGSNFNVAKWNPFNNTYSNTTIATEGGTLSVGGMAVDWVDGRYCVAYSFVYGGDYNCIAIYNRSGSRLYYKEFRLSDNLYKFNDILQFEGYHGVWAYSNISTARILTHLDNDLSEIATYEENKQDFLYDLSTEYNGRGCWYTNSIDNTLVHMSTSGAKLLVVAMALPRALTRTTDGGCWVYDNSDKKIYRYSFEGDIINTFNVPYNYEYGSSGVSKMTDDMRDGFWYSHGDLVRHVTSDGIVDAGPLFVSDISMLNGGPTGCFVHSADDNIMYWINMDGNIAYTRSMPSSEGSIFGMFYYGYDEFLEFKSKYIPVSYDPVWASDTTLSWNEVNKDGYFLPKAKYHQVDVKLWGEASLNGVYMSPAIRTQDIQPRQSKNIYVKTDIPFNTTIADYELNLRTWWGVAD